MEGDRGGARYFTAGQGQAKTKEHSGCCQEDSTHAGAQEEAEAGQTTHCKTRGSEARCAKDGRGVTAKAPATSVPGWCPPR